MAGRELYPGRGLVLAGDSGEEGAVLVRAPGRQDHEIAIFKVAQKYDLTVCCSTAAATTISVDFSDFSLEIRGLYRCWIVSEDIYT